MLFDVLADYMLQCWRVAEFEDVVEYLGKRAVLVQRPGVDRLEFLFVTTVFFARTVAKAGSTLSTFMASLYIVLTSALTKSHESKTLNGVASFPETAFCLSAYPSS